MNLLRMVPLLTAAALTCCAVGSELDRLPFAPAKDDAGSPVIHFVPSTPDASAPDVALEETDSSPPETDPIDTASPDTSPVAEDTASSDSGSDTGSADTGSAPADTAPVDTAPPDPPTVTIETPSSNVRISYTTSSLCQGQPFTITFAAAAGLASLQWKLVKPNAATATTPMQGVCNGDTAYAYFLDPAKYFGSTGGVLQENVAIAGSYSGSAGAGRWWWCTAPGESLNANVASPPAPGAAGVVPLADSCSATSMPALTDLASRWQFEVTVTDKVGKTAVATSYFWIHQ